MFLRNRFSHAGRWSSLLKAIGTALLCLLSGASLGADTPKPEPGEMAGYLIVPNNKVPESFNGGFSLYSAAWPFLRTYPGHNFQTGLFGTWMFAQFEGAAPTNLYSDIEGGLGWWRDTRFATETPKFIMGGVAANFSEWANGPGAGKSRNWAAPEGVYGVAQLSPWLLWPPDGLNVKQGASGELFGYGYLALPLIEPKSKTAGKEVPTGNNSWTLFLNTRNFKGPVAFFTPNFWSRAGLTEARLIGKLLDSRPADPNRHLQMETQWVPGMQATNSQGETYGRITPTSFPRNDDDTSVVVHRITSYNRDALWNPVKAWFDGGTPAAGVIPPEAGYVHSFTGQGRATWKMSVPGTPDSKKAPLAWNTFATPGALDSNTFGYRWNYDVVTKTDTAGGKLATLPEFYRLNRGTNGAAEWVPIAPRDVPPETGLSQVRFERPTEDKPEPYVTPDDTASCWKKPGPKAGPFKARLGDGSIVTYYWYRFADQPALLNADLSDTEREKLQSRVEQIHRKWKKDQEYLPAPTVGKLAEVDPGLVVVPPPGMEAGYVPIVTRQEAAQ
jgi:hypothetical protein